MTDDQTAHTDDAPPTTWKKGDALAASAIPDENGSSVIARAVTINRPVGEVFAYFRNFANLPTFMENVECIDILDNTRSHWVVKAPAGKTVAWDAVVTEEVQDSVIAWTSEPGADVANSGRVEFRDAGARGTVVTATIARGYRWQAYRQDVPTRTRDPGASRPTALQAVDGNRRDRDRRDEPKAA